MKSFKTYLTESTKVYEFRIKLACEMDKTAEEKLKAALEAYQLDSFKSGTHLPIAEHIDFPQCGPTEVNVYEVALHYPVIENQLRQLVHEKAGIALECIRVIPGYKTSPYEAILAGEEQSKAWKEGDAVLAQEDMTTEAAGDLVGDKRVSSLLKDLEEELKDTRQWLGAANVPPQAKDTNQLPQGKMSPVGSKQNKIPSPVKGRK